MPPKVSLCKSFTRDNGDEHQIILEYVVNQGGSISLAVRGGTPYSKMELADEAFMEAMNLFTALHDNWRLLLSTAKAGS
jgi:hypothetical protein